MMRCLHSRGARRLVATAIALGVVCAVPARMTARQSLTGKALQPVQDAESMIGGIIDMFTSGGEKRVTKAVIERVVVTEDAARRLVVAVTYSGLGNLRLAGEIRGRDKRRQPQIQGQPVALTADAGQATLAFELQPMSPEGAKFDSAYLQLSVVDPGRSRPLMSRVFALPKSWDGTGPADVVLKITPKPIGTAARLGPLPDYAQPPKVLVPMHTVLSPVRSEMIRNRAITAAAARRTDDTVVTRAAAQPAPQVPPPAAPANVRISGEVVTARRDIGAKAKPAADQLVYNPKLILLDRFKYGVKPEDAQNGAQGPAAAPIELLEGLRTEDIGLQPALLLSIASSVYADKNPASGIFYYHPRSYHLEWTAESGHGMRILYGAAHADGAAGDVLMAARLQSGLDSSEVQLATDLLQAYRRRNPSTAFTALRPMPLEKNGVDVSLASVLGQYAIAKEKIAITALSDVLGEIEVSWVTDPVTKENVQLALQQDIGVGGDVSFTAAGGALVPQVPIAILLADRDSFGRVRWNRADGWRNATPYPVRLRYLHALVIDPRNNLPILYSWSLDNVEVAPQARVEWDPAAVPAWVDTEAKRIWVDYGVVETCDPCDKLVLDAITGGVTSIAAEQITFHTITPLADVGGYEITAYVRSKYFDPKDRTVLEKPVLLKADSQDFTLRPVFNVVRPAGEPLFEYLLELAMPDGTIHRGTRWIASENLRVLVGRAQLEQSLGTLPPKVP